jgi:hypothetical protein
MAQDVCDGLPSGTVGECAVDQDNTLDGSLAGAGEPDAEQRNESKRRGLH